MDLLAAGMLRLEMVLSNPTRWHAPTGLLISEQPHRVSGSVQVEICRFLFFFLFPVKGEGEGFMVDMQESGTQGPLARLV